MFSLKIYCHRIIRTGILIISLLLCIMLIAATEIFAGELADTAEASRFRDNGFYYEIIDVKNKEVKLLDTSSEDCILTDENSGVRYCYIPETVKYKNKTYKVTRLGSGCLQDVDCEVRMSNNINSIETKAFSRDITAIYMSDAITELPKKLFCDGENTPNLSYIKLPDKLESIPRKAFYECTKLSGIVLPKGLKTVGTKAFRKNVKVVYLEGKVPENINKISGLMKNTIFYVNERYCEDLTKILKTRIENGAATVRTYSKGSNGNWRSILVNPWNYLSSDFKPKLADFYGGKIDTRVFDIANYMFKDAKKDGINLELNSGYRSKETQTRLYEKKVKSYTDIGYSRSAAEAKAATITARPDTSEHQTGLALDILSDEYRSMAAHFAGTKAYSWLSKNAYKYGFIMRYPEDKLDITGVIFEPWHWRYVGVDIALEMHNKDICFEQWCQYQNALQ